jgi:glycosyltransferase involved in cell wall biosynthesis
VRTNVVHCHNVTATLLGAPAAWLARAGGVVSTRHGSFAEGASLKRERRFWTAARFCDRVVMVSESSRTSMAALPFAQISKTITIRNGAEPRALKASGTTARSGFAVISVARLKLPKDHETLLRAIALIRMRIPDLSLMIVGSGPMESQLKELAQSLDIAELVSFLGDRDDVGDLLSRADVFALISRSEGLPLSMLEAMAAGLPLIVSEVGGIPEVARELRGARLVPAGDVTGVASAILDYAERRGELAHLGEQNRRYFEEHYSAEPMWKAYADLYLECVAAGR